MQDATAIHGHDIIDLVATYPDGIRLSQLMELVGERYGRSVTFHTCSAMGMDLDGLLAFLEARDKVRIKSGVVFPGGSPACEHRFLSDLDLPIHRHFNSDEEMPVLR